MSWAGIALLSSTPPSVSASNVPHCELGFFWDAVKQKCRKKILQIRVMSVSGSLPGHVDGHGHIAGIPNIHAGPPGPSTDFFNSASGFLFTLFYIAAIVFVVKLYFRYLCCWRTRVNSTGGLYEQTADQRQLDLRRRGFFADAARLRGSPTNRFHMGPNGTASHEFVVAIPPSYSNSSDYAGNSSADKPPSYAEATANSKGS